MGTDLIGRPLRAGALEAVLEGSDLRHVTWHGHEVVRRLYVAVRPPDWSTVAPLVISSRVHEDDDDFRVELECLHRGSGIAYRWNGTITGSADGVLTYRMDGRAETGFSYRRVGLCVLHPPSVAGSRYVATESRGATAAGVLDRLVAPQRAEGGVLLPAVGPFRRLELGPTGRAVSLSFEGDDFELEDQRNWTDASFKTYSTPLAAGAPAPATAGGAFVQSVEMRLPRRTSPVVGTILEDPVQLSVTGRTGGRVGAVGVVADPAGGPHSPEAREMLREARLGHLRLELRPGDSQTALAARIDLARDVQVPVEVALYTSMDEARSRSIELVELLAGLRIARVLVLPLDPEPATATEVTASGTVATVRAAVVTELPHVPVGGGSDMHFCELNRWRPPPGAFDVVAFPVVAQEHAADDRSMVEAHQVLGDVMATCRSFVGDTPVAVGPITLRRRSPTTPPDRGADPAADPRQHTAFAAAWLLGEVGALLSAGADSVTAFTTSGGRGIVMDDGPEPVASPSLAVLGALSARRGEQVVRVSAPDPLLTAAFGSTDGASTRLVVADLSGRGQSVRLPQGARTVATLEGAQWRARPASGTTVDLAPDGIIQLECTAAPGGHGMPGGRQRDESEEERG